jgi:hypothetical protein
MLKPLCSSAELLDLLSIHHSQYQRWITPMSPLHGVHSLRQNQSSWRILAFVAGHLVSMVFGLWTLHCKGNRWFPQHPFLSHEATDPPRIRPRVEIPRSGSAAPARVNGRHTPPNATAPHLTRGPHLRRPAKAIRDGKGRNDKKRCHQMRKSILLLLLDIIDYAIGYVLNP